IHASLVALVRRPLARSLDQHPSIPAPRVQGARHPRPGARRGCKDPWRHRSPRGAGGGLRTDHRAGRGAGARGRYGRNSGRSCARRRAPDLSARAQAPGRGTGAGRRRTLPHHGRCRTRRHAHCPGPCDHVAARRTPMITLYTFGPAFGLPDPSPFVTKAEVLLKMAGLDYRTDRNGLRRAPKGKLPFIDDDGERIADSTFIRWHIEKKYGVDLDRGLTAPERAVAWAF